MYIRAYVINVSDNIQCDAFSLSYSLDKTVVYMWGGQVLIYECSEVSLFLLMQYDWIPHQVISGDSVETIRKRWLMIE